MLLRNFMGSGKIHLNIGSVAKPKTRALFTSSVFEESTLIIFGISTVFPFYFIHFIATGLKMLHGGNTAPLQWKKLSTKDTQSIFFHQIALEMEPAIRNNRVTATIL
tara:strand:+ start:197 stop:517 length:321 start_codon:yes stop_codon:yes gene_type:complete